MYVVDHPMNCCGFVEASGLMDIEWTGGDKYAKACFDAIEEHQKKHRRNCALISLAYPTQKRAIEYAESRGYKLILEFPNPNSRNNVRLYSKVLWETRDEYMQQIKSGEYAGPTDEVAWQTKATPYWLGDYLDGKFNNKKLYKQVQVNEPSAEGIEAV